MIITHFYSDYVGYMTFQKLEFKRFVFSPSKSDL